MKGESIRGIAKLTEKENKASDKRSRMKELENWLNYIN